MGNGAIEVKVVNIGTMEEQKWHRENAFRFILELIKKQQKGGIEQKN